MWNEIPLSLSPKRRISLSMHLTDWRLSVLWNLYNIVRKRWTWLGEAVTLSVETVRQHGQSPFIGTFTSQMWCSNKTSRKLNFVPHPLRKRCYFRWPEVRDIVCVLSEGPHGRWNWLYQRRLSLFNVGPPTEGSDRGRKFSDGLFYIGNLILIENLSH